MQAFSNDKGANPRLQQSTEVESDINEDNPREIDSNQSNEGYYLFANEHYRSMMNLSNAPSLRKAA